MLKVQINTIYLFFVFIDVLSQFVPIPLINRSQLILGIIILLISSNFKSIFSAGKEYKTWAALFVYFVLFSTLWSIDSRLTLFILIKNILPIFCLTFSLSRYISSYKRLIDILKLLYISGCLSLIYLFLFVDLTLLAGNRINAAMTDEGLAETWNINSIGMNLALTILFGYLVARYIKKKLMWAIWTIVSVAMLFTIMLTGSRKAILLLLLPFIIFAIYDYKKHFLKALIMAICACALLWVTLNVEFFYEIIGKRIEDMINILTGNDTGQEDNSRKVLIMLGLEWFSERPFLGYGMNCFRVLSNVVPRFAGLHFYAHNNYIEILVGGGIVGFSIFYSYVILILRRLYKHSGIYFRYAAIILSILIIMDFAQVSYYDTIMQMLILFAFIFVRLDKIESIKTQ